MPLEKLEQADGPVSGYNSMKFQAIISLSLRTISTDISDIFVYYFLLKSLLTDALQVDRYTLLITELGTEIISLMLRYRFNCAIM